MAKAMGTVHLIVKAECQDRGTLVFEVEDLGETVEQLRSRRLHLASEPRDYPDWTIRAAHLRDPDGNLIELWTPLARWNG